MVLALLIKEARGKWKEVTNEVEPMTAVRTPSTFERKNGIKLISISEETSVKKDVSVTAHTLRGKLRRLFCFCMFIPFLDVILPKDIGTM